MVRVERGWTGLGGGASRRRGRYRRHVRSKEATRQRWDRMAEYYGPDGQRRLERIAIGDSRVWICRQATGRTLEVAAGSGRNLMHYPADLDLTGVDLSPAMLALARAHAAKLGRTVVFREADAEALPFGDCGFDTVVCTLSVCEIPDREAAISEMHRVLRPGGRLLLLDHFEPRWLRERPATIAARKGFQIERRQRPRLGLIERLIALRA